MELFDVRDSHGNKLGYTLARGASLAKNEYFGIVNILMMNKDGKVLMTKRHPSKPSGNLWEVTGGGILAGEEAMDAAVRELGEETGIKITKDDLVFLGEDGMNGWYCYSFMTKVNDLSSFKLDLNEAIDYKWLTLDEFYDFLKTNQVIDYINYRMNLYKNKIVEVLCR